MDDDEMDGAFKARDDAMRRVEANADKAWMAEAMVAVHILATKQDELIANDLWKLIDKPREPRATGSVMVAAARNGWITQTKRYTPIPSKSSHARPVLIWESRLRSR